MMFSYTQQGKWRSDRHAYPILEVLRGPAGGSPDQIPGPGGSQGGVPEFPEMIILVHRETQFGSLII